MSNTGWASIEQQTATSEVLQVISSSPGDLEPVFRAMLANATRICEAKFGVLFRHDGHGAFQSLAWLGASPALAEYHRQRGTIPAPLGTPLDRLLRTRDVIHIADDSVGPSPGAAARLGGARSLIAVPMFKDDRTGDHLQHLRRRGLPFQRLTLLVEQPGVLDGDDGLRGEVFDQLDLLVAERPNLLAIRRSCQPCSVLIA